MTRIVSILLTLTLAGATAVLAGCADPRRSGYYEPRDTGGD